MASEAELLALAERCEKGSGRNNALDVAVEVALFEPDALTVSARPNAAGSKVIFSDINGKDATYWAQEWTDDRPGTAAALRARAATMGGSHDV
jgi:hypothetical protein